MWTTFFICLAAGAAGGTLSGTLGVGGGAILPPLLVAGLRIGQHEAQGISLAALLPPVGLPALLAYRRLGVRPGLAVPAWLIAGFLPAAAAGAWVAQRLPEHALRATFALFLVALAVQTAYHSFRPHAVPAAAPAAGGHRVPAPRASAIGALAGLFSGMLGIGGAIVMVPLLQRWGRLPRLEAQACTLAMMLAPIGLPAVLVYAREQAGLPIPALVGTATGALLGSAIGGRLAGRLGEGHAARAFAALLLALAVSLAIARR